ncbi:FRG domain-containing protein [Paenibacillus sp. y28]|uniref:FRG domain-containing protein n=1 Tax=Paenibacillus sp. y28 TaxID=3129110 RepID=UPI0030174B2B
MVKPHKPTRANANGIPTIRGVNSVEKFLRAVDHFYQLICPENKPNKCELWFRGVKRTDYNLDPSIARGLGAQAEIVYLSKFRSLAYPYLQETPYFPYSEDRNSYWGWLFMMQHYGVPTRLLDWSREALVALLFAVDPNRTPKEEEVDSAVWLLNPVELNKAFQFYDFLQRGYIPNVTEPAFNAKFGPNVRNENVKAAAAIGPLNNPRIIKQAGTFTVYPKRRIIVPLNQLPDAANYLYKIVITKESRNDIYHQLNHYGLTVSDLFPQLDKVKDEIEREINAENLTSSSSAVFVSRRV